MLYDWFQQVPADCPGIYAASGYCNDQDKVKPSFGMVPVYLSLTSCIASTTGSMLLIVPYIIWRDMRHGVRAVLTYLAIADLCTAVSYIVASLNYIVYQSHQVEDFISACSTFSSVCQIQAFVSSWASLSSFWWTIIFAFYLHRIITKGSSELFPKYIPFLHLFVWGSPILLLLPLLVTGSLGYSLFSAGGWCFIASNKRVGGSEVGHFHQYADYDLSVITILKILVGGKAVEISAYFIVFVLYGLTSMDVRRKKKESLMEDESLSVTYRRLLQRIEPKLYVIPFAFILLRLWGTFQFIFSIAVFARGGTIDETGCVSPAVFYTYYALSCLQAIGDGGQGWCNAILYIWFSPNMRDRLWSLVIYPWKKCCRERDTGSIQKNNTEYLHIETL